MTLARNATASLDRLVEVAGEAAVAVAAGLQCGS